MRFNRLISFTLCTALAVTGLASISMIANAEDATSELQRIAKLNALDLAGKSPFHLKLSFQMYDLAGQASDTGTVEEWWSSGQLKVVVTAKSLSTPAAVPLDSASGLDPRELFLLKNLLSSLVHPAPTTAFPPSLKIEERDRAFSGINLKCFNVAAPPPDQGTGRQALSYCAEKNTDALRFQLEGAFQSTARNQIGSFHDTEVSLGAEIAYNDRLAISGKIIAMQSFDPAKTSVQMSPQIAEDYASKDILPGHIINKVAPTYPATAKAAHIAGTVVLHATITKDGKINDLFVLASPSQALSASAMDAVKQWTYQPYRSSGTPIDMATTINVNFMFGIPSTTVLRTGP